MNRKQLEAVYLDWYNNFVSYERYAEYCGLTVEEATKLIEVARMVTHTPHPEA